MMKNSILILMFVLFFTCPISSWAEEKPTDEVINNALVTSIENRNPDLLKGANIEIQKKHISNEYILKKEGETVYCYDIECIYKWGAPGGDLLPHAWGHRDILKIVKRGKKWYLY